MKLPEILKPGRNERCPCGSGKKYKHCHGSHAHPDFERGHFIDPSKADMDGRWLSFIEEVVDLLGISHGREWMDARNSFSSGDVLNIYAAYRRYFPPGAQIINHVTANKKGVAALYAGDISPKHIETNIIRFSLYADKIYVFDPFHSPYLLMPDGENPERNPDKFLLETLKATYFTYRMMPWIKSGIVSIIPNLAHFDPVYRQLDLNGSKEVNETLGNADIKGEVAGAMLTKYVEAFHQFSGEELENVVAEEMRGAPDHLIAAIVQYIELQVQTNPALLPRLGEDRPSSQYVMYRGGASLITIILSASMLNAFPYTDSRYRSRVLNRMSQTSERGQGEWTALAHAFSDLDFTFLNSVSPDFAINLKQDGRLSNLRNFLFRLWQKQERPQEITETQSRIFADELREEHRKALEEWDSIRRDLSKFVATNTAATVSGGLVFGFPAVAAMLPTVHKVADYLIKVRRFRAHNPMSALIDLERKSS